MFDRQAVLQRLDHSWRRDRPHDEGNTDWFEWLRWKRLGGQARPETVSVSCYGREPGNSVLLNEVVDVRALDVGGAVIPRSKCCVEPSVSLAWPRFREAVRQVLRIRSHVER